MMSNEIIKKLEEKGFKRWTNYGKDRLYASAYVLGLECKYYKTGNICDAQFNGQDVSNCWAREMKAAKTYINVEDSTIHCDIKHSSLLVEAAEQIMNEIAE